MLTIMVVVCAGLLTACAEDIRHPTELGYTVKVTYDFNGGEFNGNESMDFYFKENSPVLRPGDTSTLGNIVKMGYFISGWRVAYLADSVAQPTEEFWDFANDRVQRDMVLIAEWVKNPTVNIVYVDADGNALAELANGQAEPASGSTNVVLRDAEMDGYTFYGYYLDEQCTQAFDNSKESIKVSYDPESPDYNKTVYAKLLEGEWFIIRSTNDFNLLSAHADANVYLDADLDFTNLIGDKGTWNGLSVFRGRFEGNGHTLSNFTTTFRQSSSRSNYGLFGELGEGAVIRNLKLCGIDVSLSVSSNAGANFGFLFGYGGENISVTDVELEDCTLRLSRTGGGSNSTVTIDPSFRFGVAHPSAILAIEGTPEML